MILWAEPRLWQQGHDGQWVVEFYGTCAYFPDSNEAAKWKQALMAIQPNKPDPGTF